MDIKERISKWVDEREADIIADISRLVAVKSIRGEASESKPFGEGPAEALNLALDICREHGFKVINHDNYVMTADMNDKETVLDILAHLDVVGVGEGWDSDPFKAEVRDGCLYGRGTDDDKGPAIMALYAMKCIKELGEDRKNVRLILGTDEESGSSDVKYYYERNKPAPNTFTPDAGFPVINVEKGMYRPEFSKKWEPETELPRVLSFSGGFRLNVVPADASALVAGLELKTIENICTPLADSLKVELRLNQTDKGTELAVKGTAGHAAMAEQANNGLTALIKLLCALPLADCESTRAIKQLNELFPHGDTEGVAAGIALEDEISHKLTLAFTLLNMDEKGISGRFDSRVPICATAENCKNVVDKKLKDFGFEVRGEMVPHHYTPEDRPFIKVLLNSYEMYTGLKGECQSIGGGTYVHDVEGGVAFGATMPGFESNLHGANERLNIKDALTACKIFAQVIYDMCRL
ncbi:MAG: M20 family metallopeptidase [Papillibacter sp.]|nr:M20 family metallopeptidase [Papillibacter sp.]